jgi:hypothetical protein
MIHERITAGRSRAGGHVLLSVAAGILPVLAVAAACATTLAHRLPIAIDTPAILLVAALLVLLPCRQDSLATLQRVVTLYLICIPVNETHLQFFALSLGSVSLRVACSVLPLALFAAGYLAARWTGPRAPETAAARDFSAGWFLAGAVILLHIGVLAPLLYKVYGYGYEQDLPVLGSFTLYLLIFLASWRSLARMHLRQALALVLAVFYVVVAATHA